MSNSFLPQQENSPDKEKLYEAAMAHMRAGRYDEARQAFESCLEQEKTAEVYHGLGVASCLQGDKDKAIECFEAAVAIDPEHEASYISAGEIYLEEGMHLHAMGCYGCAIGVNAENKDSKEKFVRVARHCDFSNFNPQLKVLMTECFETDNIDFLDMWDAWHGMLKVDPDFAPLFKLVGKKDYKSFKKAFFKLKNTAFLCDPFFLAGLKKVRIADLQFEQFLVHLRRFMLESLEEDKDGLGCPWVTMVAAAFGQYCFVTEYIFSVSDEELQRVAALRANVESGLEQSDERVIAVLSCYIDLHSLENAAAIYDRYCNSVLAEVVTLQIHDHGQQQKVREAIEAITEVANIVSKDVQKQYEQSPYPRWNSYSRVIYDEKNEGYLRNAKGRILNAGCGTGREAVELATVFPDSDILAIDLSKASLAYGQQKADMFGIGNVSFKQADILALESMDKQFDFIASSGVLHHMEDPMAGWKVLRGLIKDGGVMRIALYSDRARQPIVEARKVIKERGYDAEPDGIRRFRQECSKHLKKDTFRQITSSAEYYAMSECRDLLFHVQEHRFNIPYIKQCLNELGLSFCGFQVSGHTMAAYRKFQANDSEAVDLDGWARFEEKNPSSFAGMYRFWCRAV